MQDYECRRGCEFWGEVCGGGRGVGCADGAEGAVGGGG